MTALLQCQAEVARFASGESRVDELRRTTTRAAVRRLVAGDRAGALREMYDGMAAQAPLTFKAPAVTQ